MTARTDGATGRGDGGAGARNTTMADRITDRETQARIGGPPALRQCPECNRVFDLTDEGDAEEWAYGHDCEDTT